MTLLTVLKSEYLRPNKREKIIFKSLKTETMALTALTLLSRKTYLIFLNFVFNCRFYFVFSVV